MKTIHQRNLDSQAVVRRYSLKCPLKSGALKNFTNFTGKQLLKSFLVTLLTFKFEACNFLKKRFHGDLQGNSSTDVFLQNLQNL